MSTLVVQSSARSEGSVTRRLATALADRLGGRVTVRETADLPFVTEDWIAARDARGDGAPAFALSEALIAEVEAHDTLVIAAPIYDFGVPAALKAWIDQVARPRKTFRYTAAGPEGLLRDKRAFVVTASAGTAVDGPIDFATPYLRHMLKVMGIDDVTVIADDAAPEYVDAAARRAA